MDGYMNIAMEQTQEYFNGKLKNTYADTFIRGNNGTDPYSFSCRLSELHGLLHTIKAVF
jgi:hypothetical protein